MKIEIDDDMFDLIFVTKIKEDLVNAYGHFQTLKCGPYLDDIEFTRKLVLSFEHILRYYMLMQDAEDFIKQLRDKYDFEAH